MSKLVGSWSSGAAVGQYVTVSHTLAVGLKRIVIAYVAWEDTDERAPSVLYDQGGGGEVAMSTVASTSKDTGAQWFGSKMFYLLEADLPSNGAHNVRVNAGAACNYLSLSVWCFDGLAQEAPHEESASTVEVVQTASGTLTPIVLPAVLMAGFQADQAAPAWSAYGTDQVKLGERDFTGASQVCTYEIASSTSDTQSATHTSGNCLMGHVAGAFAIAPGGMQVIII